MPTDAPPVLAQLNLVVADMAASVAFYRLLGLTIDDTRPYSAHHIDVVMPGGFTLDFFRPVDRTLAVDDVFAKVTAAGHAGQQAPYDAFWGARYAVVEDPDGNPVGLMSPIDADRRSRPPSM